MNLSWYIVEHFAPDDMRERHALRSYVVEGTSHGDALSRVPEHPREWTSRVKPVELIEKPSGQ